MKYNCIKVLLLCLFIEGCMNNNKEVITFVKEWSGKEFLFPENSRNALGERFEYLVNDKEYGYGKYTIISYIDSIGCTSCKLNLPGWEKMISVVDSVSNNTIPFLFIFNPRDKNELLKLLKRLHFPAPTYIDENDSFNRLNHFPKEMEYQTFLIDRGKKIVAIGNPVLNPKVKEFYLKIISGEALKKKLKTERKTLVTVDKQLTSFGDFDWKNKQKAVFQLKNTGKTTLVINDVVTSCGCTSVKYAKEPVRPGKTIALNVVYQAEHPEHFDKTVTVYCNASSSPIRLKISGNAQ